jgi:hypothetical protein
MRTWSENNPHVERLLTLKQRTQLRSLLFRLLQTGLALTLIVLLALLSGCATRLPTPCEPLPSTSPPVPPKSPPSVSYSQQVQSFLDESAKRLTDGLTKP